MPKFGINGWCWSYPFYEPRMFKTAITKAEEFGFDGIEIPVEDPDRLDVRALQEELDSTKLKRSSICSTFGSDRDLISSDQTIRANCIKYVKRNVEIASELGAEIVLVVPSAVGKLKTDLSRKEEWHLAVQGLTELSDFAKDFSVCLAVEPLNRFETYFINILGDAVRLVEDVNRENVRVLSDTFHMNIEDDDLAAEIEHAGQLIAHCHANENDRGTPGDGHVPFRDIMRAFKSIRYNRWFVIETFQPGIKEIAVAASIWRPLAKDQDTLARDGLSYLRRIWGEC